MGSLYRQPPGPPPHSGRSVEPEFLDIAWDPPLDYPSNLVYSRHSHQLSSLETELDSVARDAWDPPLDYPSNLVYSRHSYQLSSLGTHLDSVRRELFSLAGLHAIPSTTKELFELGPTDRQATYEPEVIGLVGGAEISCLPDRGAGCNFMSLQYAERHGIPIIPPDPNSKITRLGNGKEVEIVGHATLPFSFKGETQSHQLDFLILPRCVKDVILGSPFLRLTKLFEHHAHRIVRKIRRWSGAQACYTASQERVVGMLDGELVLALPDTGSDVMLVSEAYAKRRGLHIDQGAHYCFPLTFADSSQSWTSGIVKDVRWQYGTDGGKSSLVDFYVLKDLQCDVLLSYDFLHRTDAFTLHEQWMSLLDDSADFENRAISERLLSTITRNPASPDSDSRLKRFGRKLMQSGSGKQANPAVIPCQPDPAATAYAWDREHRRLLRNLQTIDDQMKKLPPGMQDDTRVALEAAEAAFKTHMASQPGAATSTGGGNNSSASSSTAVVSQAGS